MKNRADRYIFKLPTMKPHGIKAFVLCFGGNKAWELEGTPWEAILSFRSYSIKKA